MADQETFSDDISALWGAADDSPLGPLRRNGTTTNGHDASPAPPAPANPSRQQLDQISQSVLSVQADIAALGEVVKDLREEVAILRRRKPSRRHGSRPP